MWIALLHKKMRSLLQWIPSLNISALPEPTMTVVICTGSAVFFKNRCIHEHKIVILFFEFFGEAQTIGGCNVAFRRALDQMRGKMSPECAIARQQVLRSRGHILNAVTVVLWQHSWFQAMRQNQCSSRIGPRLIDQHACCFNWDGNWQSLTVTAKEALNNRTEWNDWPPKFYCITSYLALLSGRIQSTMQLFIEELRFATFLNPNWPHKIGTIFFVRANVLNT